MTEDDKLLVERLRWRVSPSEILLVDPPRPAPDRDCHYAADRIEAQAAEIERLREAGNDLGFYAGHEDACDCVKGWAKGPCNCGYTEAWQAWHNLEGKAEQ